MSVVFQEFCDANLHRAFPLTDDAVGTDQTGAFTLPTSLITDIFLCVPNLAFVDCSKFYIENILVRRMYIDITIGYDDPGTPQPLGVFRNISTTAPLHSSYAFTPYEPQLSTTYAPLYSMSGQITIGDPTETVRLLGSWSFSPSATAIVPVRISRGLLNVQYISINNQLYTGDVRIREGTNVQLETETIIVDGEPRTIITVNASLTAGSTLQLNSDEDILNALTDRYGLPIRSINGLLPDGDRNFQIQGEDCTVVEPLPHGVAISNPCAAPCCDQDANIAALLESIANLNLRYAHLKAFYDAESATLRNLQNKLMILGAEV